MKKTAFIILFIFAVINLTCSPDKEKKLVVGFSMSSIKDPFLLTLKKSAEEAAEKHGIKLIVTESQANLAKQINAVEDLMQRGIDILVLNPLDAKGIVPAVEAANAKGIPGLTVDTGALGGKIVTFVGSDNLKGGELAGEYIIKKLSGRGRVVVLDDVPGKQAIIDRIKGFKRAVDKAPDIEIVTIQPAYGKRDMAITVTENILQAHPDIDAIFATCDAMALGALDVLTAAGRKDKIILVGFDACDEALEAIKKGTLDADVAQFPNKMGSMFIEAVVKTARGEKLPEYIPVPVVLVSKENVDTFNKDVERNE